jgi:hypothetical protein
MSRDISKEQRAASFAKGFGGQVAHRVKCKKRRAESLDLRATVFAKNLRTYFMIYFSKK